MENNAIKTKTVTDLTEKTTPADTDLFMAGNAGTATLKKLKWSSMLAAIKTKIAEWTFQTLNTSDKTIPGALNELNNKIIYTGYATSHTLSLPLGQVCIVYTTVVGYYCVSLSGGITLLTMYKTEDGIAYVVDNNARTITFTAKEGGNVRFVVIKP